MIQYLKNILIWLDIGLNVVFFSGSHYETISSRIGKRAAKGERWACVLCGLMGKLDKRHCEKSIVDDKGLAQAWWKVINPIALALAVWVIWRWQ